MKRSDVLWIAGLVVAGVLLVAFTAWFTSHCASTHGADWWCWLR